MKSKHMKSALAAICLSLVITDATVAQSKHSNASEEVLLITSAQMDLLSENGKAWAFTKASEEKNRVRKHLKQLLKIARQKGIPVIHSPVGFDYEAMKDFQPLNPIQGIIVQHRLLDIKTSGVQFVPEAMPLDGEIVLPYRQGFSAFWAQSIQAHLQRLGVKTIYIAGMLAEGCITSHVRDAAENGLATVVISDAIGSTGLELLEASSKTLGLHAKAVIRTQEFLKWME